MYIIGDEEISALERIIRKEALFRYRENSECERFEKRYADYLGARHFALSASGSNALTAALIGLGLGPGDEVLIPAHTYMATATSVLSAGAIPVIVDIDETLTISPAAVEAAVGPSTRAVIPVHMWGTACDMGAIMDIARRHDLLVVEDACQGVGGSYEGRKFGTIGDAGCFSFNYFKNMTAGEGGGVATDNDVMADRARCVIDPCHFYWQGRDDNSRPFSSNGARASELMGAVLNVQLDRIDGMIGAMRRERDTILDATKGLGNLGLHPAPLNSPDHDCGTYVFYTFPTMEAAERFTRIFPGIVAGKTGRHNYTEWDQVLMGAGAAHPAMNPYNMPANTECRKSYSKDMCAASLEILNRTVMVPTHPKHSESDVADIIHNIGVAARTVLDGQPLGEADLKSLGGLDAQKYDLKTD